MPFLLKRFASSPTSAELSTPDVRAAWREQNVRSLMDISAVQTFSADEWKRLSQVGDDPEQMRQALIGIHEDRLANLGLDLGDAQERKKQLAAAATTNKSFADQPQTKRLAQLVDEDEGAATSQISQYALAVTRLRSWSPLSFKSYIATRRPAQSPAVVSSAPKPDAMPDQESNPQPNRGAAKIAKPDPAIPLTPEPSTVAGSHPAAVANSRFPTPADLANATQHPSVTVYADDPPAVRPGSNLAEDPGVRERTEGEIRETLRRWASAMTRNDPAAEAAEYAPHMNRYFLRTNVSHAFVVADKTAYLRRGNLTAGFALRDVTFENETANTADVRLVKDVTWQQGAQGETHKLIRSRLHLEKFSDGWKITGEQDFR